jgi:uncharacterized membrane protein
MVVEERRRSMVKAASYRVWGSSVTFLVIYISTGSMIASTTGSVLDIFGKSLLYFAHERVWDRIDYGRRRPT